MDPLQVLNIINFIKCRSEPSLVVESRSHAQPLAEVLIESAKLYRMLNEANDLDAIVEQISIKNKAAKKYLSVTGQKWLF